MKPLSKRYQRLIERLEELTDSEHVCGCDSSTCDISASWSAGHTLWSIYLFASSGAASDEFNALYRLLPKRFKVDAERERKSFVKYVDHTECPHCNAITWDPQWVTNNGLVWCGSCGNEFTEEKGA